VVALFILNLFVCFFFVCVKLNILYWRCCFCLSMLSVFYLAIPVYNFNQRTYLLAN